MVWFQKVYLSGQVLFGFVDPSMSSNETKQEVTSSVCPLCGEENTERRTRCHAKIALVCKHFEDAKKRIHPDKLRHWIKNALLRGRPKGITPEEYDEHFKVHDVNQEYVRLIELGLQMSKKKEINDTAASLSCPLCGDANASRQAMCDKNIALVDAQLVNSKALEVPPHILEAWITQSLPLNRPEGVAEDAFHQHYKFHVCNKQYAKLMQIAQTCQVVKTLLLLR
jgi:predicted RNA-binding Zn-ribbon protein involved in translation (DUF1610 family)